ncbi:hypothetical protein [Stygiolobus azoricus]|uniref:Uncharacterized protein n=1 Tax=Stygiolobus azoricus TaxID=41675 RepID=A0A650CM48_9CREN|nr:hypothetical protein [Stygiolobus azoricus]QGR18537.1 hypothetical protein D1868_00010 [Stygiolobus azoricus]
MKALATSIALIILLVILISVLIPAFFILYNTPYHSNQGNIAAQAYQQEKKLELNNVLKGNPLIYYSSGTSPYVEIKVQTVQTPINITQIYYFNGTMWVPTLNTSINVGSSMIIPLPKAAFDKPIVIVTGLSNIFFLNPNTSVTTSVVSGPAGKVAVYVIALALNKTTNGYAMIPVNTSVQFGGILMNTPFILYVNPGTYNLVAKNPEIFLSQYGLTASFLNWSVTGYGTLSSPNSPSTSLTVSGPTIVTLLYNTSLKHYKVVIQFSLPNNTPLPIEGTTTDPKTGALLTNVNSSLTVYVDNKPYLINYTHPNITLELTSGYHSVQYPTTIYLMFNYTLRGTTIPYGEMIKYTLYNVKSSNSSAIIITNNNMFKVTGNGTVYITFQPSVYYYLVIVKNNFTLPSGVKLISNSSPILGDIAGQLLQANVTPPQGSGVPSQVLALGPIKDYTYEMLYLPSGNKISVTYFYLWEISGSYTLNLPPAKTFHSLISQPQYFIVNNATWSHTYSYNSQNIYSPPIYIYSPTVITVYEVWQWGGNPP